MRKLGFCLMVIFIAMTVSVQSQTLPSYLPTNGLVGWWPFNGNANDESGSGNNGTVNGATLTLDRYGNVNSAYGFSNSNIEVNHNSLFGFNQNGSFTVSFWYNSNSSDPLQHLIGKRPLNSNIFNWQFFSTKTCNFLFFYTTVYSVTIYNILPSKYSTQISF